MSSTGVTDLAVLWNELDDLDRRRRDRPRVRPDLLSDVRACGDPALLASTLLVVAHIELNENQLARFDTLMAELDMMLVANDDLVNRMRPGRARLRQLKSVLTEITGRIVEHWDHALDAFVTSSADVLSVEHLRATVNMLNAEYERGHVERIGRFDALIASWPVSTAHARAHRATINAQISGLAGDWPAALRHGRAAVEFARHLTRFPRYEAHLAVIDALLHLDQLSEAEQAIRQIELVPSESWLAGYPLLLGAELARRQRRCDDAETLMAKLWSSIDRRYAGELPARAAAFEAHLALDEHDPQRALELVGPLLTNNTTIAAYRRACRVGLAAARQINDVEAELEIGRRATRLARNCPRWELSTDVVALLDRAMERSAQGATEHEGEDRELTTRRIRHDLMSVVNAIQLHVEMFRETDGEHSLEPVVPALNLVNAMADQLSLFSSLRGGLVVPEPAIIDLSSLVFELVELNRQGAAARDLNLISEVPDAAAVLTLVDRRLVSRILNNLITNAVKYTPSGGTVQVAITPINDTVEVTISDSGPGMSEVVRWRLTGEGAKVLSPIKGEGGLGLFIVRRAAQLLDIALTVSESDLGGTRVALALPVGLE